MDPSEEVIKAPEIPNFGYGFQDEARKILKQIQIPTFSHEQYCQFPWKKEHLTGLYPCTSLSTNTPAVLCDCLTISTSVSMSIYSFF